MKATTTSHSRAAAHYTQLAREAQEAAPPRYAFLERYLSDRAFREQVDATREKMTYRNHLLMDAGQVKYYSRRSDPPWFIEHMRERVITYARAERDYQLLITAGLSHEEACEIVNAKPEQQ